MTTDLKIEVGGILKKVGQLECGMRLPAPAYRQAGVGRDFGLRKIIIIKSSMS